MRFRAQNILTGEWLDNDVPLIRDGETPRWEMSGADSFSGVINGDHPWLRANQADSVLREWSTALYCELDDGSLWGGIVQQSGFDGPDWRVQAFGFTSYADGYAYTGDYQRYVDADPGVIVAAMWAHIQAQPDGNIGLRLKMPADLGPNIGTKDEPYELAWWEAPDLGSEFKSMATEAGFDYVERHEWVGKSSQAVPAKLRIGYGNLQGGYDGSDKGWMKKRADGQVALIGSMHVAAFVAVELHEETSKEMPDGANVWFLGRVQKRLGSSWQMAKGDGGNHLLYRSDLLTFLNVTVRKDVPDPTYPKHVFRSASAWDMMLRDSGLAVSIGGYHLRANDTDGTSRNASRLAAAADVDQLFTDNRRPRVVCGDWNDAGEGSGDVLGIVRAQTGLQSLKRREPNFTYAGWNSFGKKRQGKHIDSILTDPNEWTIDACAGVPTRGLSDHQLWLQADLIYRPPTNAGIPGAGAGQLRHILELSYPKAGRKRADLRFAQGENVFEPVAVNRDGAVFSNDVVTLGKGEGSKTLRGESVVRDGRLRRPTVYTDKLAGTKARCDALAKRERGWRNLKGSVESILVVDHSHAPIGSWSLGDDILVEAYDVPHLGKVVDWFRVVAWALVTDTSARLYLERADAFTYGPTVAPPSDDLPDEYEQGDR